MNLFRRNKDKTHGKRELRIVSASSSFGYVEAYKALRTNLKYILDTSGNCKVIMVTSSVPNEGKTNVAINLSATMAEDDKKVILLDCDLRKGTLHRYLRVSRQLPGITSVLTEEMTLDQAIIHYADLGIDVLTAGIVPPNPAELLGSEKMGRLLKELAEKYDYVICDTPPVNAVADTSALSKFTDGAILVVSHNQVTRDNVQAAKAQLESMNTSIFGVVLNMYDAKHTGTDNTHYYSYYNYNYQYGNYNYSDLPSKKLEEEKRHESANKEETGGYTSTAKTAAP